MSTYNHRPRNADIHQTWKTYGTDHPREPFKGNSPMTETSFSPIDSFLTSGLQNGKRINLFVEQEHAAPSPRWGFPPFGGWQRKWHADHQESEPTDTGHCIPSGLRVAKNSAHKVWLEEHFKHRKEKRHSKIRVCIVCLPPRVSRTFLIAHLWRWAAWTPLVLRVKTLFPPLGRQIAHRAGQVHVITTLKQFEDVRCELRIGKDFSW